jgi:hypothetical protein
MRLELVMDIATNANLIAVTPLEGIATRARHERLAEWLREHEVSLAETTLGDDARLSLHKLAVYPAAKNGCFACGPGCFTATDPRGAVYVLGDTHGDFDSVLAIFDAILAIAEEKSEANPIVYLLGDIVDRNGEGCMLECALILAILQGKLEGEFSELNKIRIGIIKGDHDIGLIYDEPYAPEARFRAMVKPADYCDWLNKRLDDGGDESVTKIGRAWIRLMKECPAAAFLEETGTLIAHGGVPREDLQRRVAAGEPYMLQSEAFAQDFEWCRMVDVKKKLLNRGSKTSEVGGQEFDSFCKTVFPAQPRSGDPTTRVRRFVFGHQHPVKGFEQYTKWYAGYEVICIASFRDDVVFGGPTIPHFVRIAATGAESGLAGKGISPDVSESVDVYSIKLSFKEDMPVTEAPGDAQPSSDQDQHGEAAEKPGCLTAGTELPSADVMASAADKPAPAASAVENPPAEGPAPGADCETSSCEGTPLG